MLKLNKLNMEPKSKEEIRDTDMGLEEENIGFHNRAYMIGEGREINKWTKRVTDELREYAFKCLGYAWMYGEDAHYYHTTNWRINFAIGCLSAFVAVIQALQLVFVMNSGGPERTVPYYILIVLSIIISGSIAVIQAYQLAIKFDVKIPRSLEMAAKFGSQCRLIKSQFAILPQYRDDPYVLMRNVTSRFDELDREKPFIQTSTYNNWLRNIEKMKEGGNDGIEIIQLPDEYSNTEIIDRSHFRGINIEENKETKSLVRIKDRIFDDLNMF